MKRVISALLFIVGLYLFFLNEAFCQERVVRQKVQGQKQVERKKDQGQNLSNFQLKTPDLPVRQAGSKLNKAFGDTIWYEDFDSLRWSQYGLGEGPEGWEFKDNTENDFLWGWANHGPRGVFTSPNFGDIKEDKLPNNTPLEILNNMGASCNNGIMQIEMDWFNTAEDGYLEYNVIEMNSYFQITLNLEDYTNIFISYNQMHSQFMGNLLLLVTSDYNEQNPEQTQWIEFDNRGAIYSNDWTHAIDRKMVFDIGAIAGGKDKVVLRWQTIGAFRSYWIIDDILLFEPYRLELELVEVFSNYNSFYCDNIPINQVETIHRSWIDFQNNGSSDIIDPVINMEILNSNKEIIYTKDSIFPILKSTEKLASFCLFHNFLPQKLDQYEVKYEIEIQDFEDQIPENNVIEKKYANITNSLLSYNHNSAPTSFISTNYNNLDTFDGNALIDAFNILDTTSIDSIGVFIGKNQDILENISQNQCKVRAVVYKNVNIKGSDFEFMYYSDFRTLNISDTMSYLHVPLGDENILYPAEYSIGFEFFTQSYKNSIEIGAHSGYCYIFMTRNVEEIGWQNKTKGIPFAPSFDIYLKPVKSQISISCNLQDQVENENFNIETDELALIIDNYNAQKIVLSDENNDQIFDTIINTIPIGDSIIFHFSINDEINSDTLSFYIDELTEDFSYTFFDNTSISIVEKMDYEVYPNPTNSTLKIRSNYQLKNDIKIYNILGKEFYIEPIINLNEAIIDVSYLSNGIYFLNINNETHKIIISR